MKVVSEQLSKSNKTHLCPSPHLPAVLVFPGSGPWVGLFGGLGPLEGLPEKAFRSKALCECR